MTRTTSKRTPGTNSSTTTAVAAGRRNDTSRRRHRVQQVIVDACTELNVSGVARAAGVHRSFLYRHPDLLDLIHQAATTPPRHPNDLVSPASLLADLAHARDRAQRAGRQLRHLERILSELKRREVWAATGLEPLDEATSLRRELDQTRQQLLDRATELEDRDRELEAARAANRELMAQLNARG